MFFTKKTSREVGQATETLACQYLEKQGLNLLQKNYLCKSGEIDLVMQDGQSLVFVEVRYRKNTNFGHAAETVNHSKQKKLIHTASHYLQNHSDQANKPARFDVISISGKADQYDINWIQDAFQVLS
ncbi:MAG: YraN family protein [Gammaproteobacteria bacterium]|nr:YraN family protein [Gammaproteobacteria bacterium]